MDFDKLLQVMIAKNGSDLFITEGVPPSLKVHGQILPMTKTPLTAEQSMALVTAIMTEAKRKNLPKPMSVSLPSRIRVRQRAFVFLPLFSVTKRAWYCVKSKPTSPPPMT